MRWRFRREGQGLPGLHVGGQPRDWVCGFTRHTLQAVWGAIWPRIGFSREGFCQASAQMEKQGQDLMYVMGLKLAKRG